MRLKSKLTIGVVAIAILIMISTTTVVYIVLSKQNYQGVNTGLTKTLNIVRDDVIKRQEKMIKDSFRMVKTNRVDKNVHYLDKLGNMGLATMNKIYWSIGTAIKQNLVAGDLWQSAVYDAEGNLIVYVRRTADQSVTAGYIHTEEKESKTSFFSALIGIEEPLKDAQWSDSGRLVLPNLSDQFGETISESATVVITQIGEALYIRSTIPLRGIRFDAKTRTKEEIFVGTVVAHQRLGPDFVKGLADLTDSEINLFQADGKLNTGTLEAYAQFQGDTARTTGSQNLDLVSQSPALKTFEVEENGYLQASLTLDGGGLPAGWLTTVAPESVVKSNTYQMIGLLGLVYLICLVIVVPIAYIFSGTIAKKANIIVAGLKDIAEGEGDLTKRLTLKDRDEMDDLASWFNIFIDKLQTLISDIVVNAGNIKTSSAEVNDLSGRMDRGAQQVSTQSQTVAEASEEMMANINAIAAAMEQSSVNLNTVSTAAEQMTATINDIAQNTTNANGVTDQAVSQARSSTQRVHELGEAAQHIGKVTETITEISEQTNLLALNATIEAARAGEAGKGFAVVANEIKELACQTAAATTEIKEQINGIQASSQGTIGDIESITKVIHEVKSIVSIIASSIEEQSAATSDVAGNVAQAYQGIQEVNEMTSQTTTTVTQVSDSLLEVKQTTGDISQRSQKVLSGTKELSAMAEQLNGLVGRFKI